MRKTQAPSSSTKFLFSSLKQEKNSNFSNDLITGKTSLPLRTTDAVLQLLLASDTGCTEKNDAKENQKKFNDLGDFDNDLFKLSQEKNKTLISSDSSKECSTQAQDSFLDLKIYNVVYGKQTKRKHKTWEGNGTLEIGAKYITLKNDEGKVIGTLPSSKSRKLEEGQRIYIGSKEVELLEVANDNFIKKNKQIEDVTNLLSNDLPRIKSSKIFRKKFQCPRLSYECGMALPEPNAEHQWYFNQKGLPVSQVYVEENLVKKLRQHQCDGITFMYECIMGYKNLNFNGVILADEMGLGKTLQCIALIWTVLKQGPYGSVPVVKKVLIVTPSSLTMNWCNEIIKWLGRVKLVPFVVSPKNKPSALTGPVMIISYEMLVRYLDDVLQHNFDLLICDEGHRLKNSNIKTTQFLNRLNCKKKILLTGTPIQNDLQEFYALVDFVNPNILGTPSEFRRHYEIPILNSHHPNVDDEVLRLGKERAQELKRITSKFLLRRTRDILSNYLPPRQDVVVFCKMTYFQKKLYNDFVEPFLNEKDSSVMFEGSAHLELITSLKKICNHPSLLNQDSEEIAVIEISGKVQITVNLLKELQISSPKEKVVIVSNSTKTLNLLEKIFISMNYSTCKLDGSTPTVQRNDIIERFNRSYCNSFIFLLSSKAGGVGLNITGASRLILFDSDWNPSTDQQAISRIWRDGQKLPVFIYRLLTTGTIEEKIYQRQISKQSLSDGTIDPESNKSVKLSKEELKEIFFECSDLKDCLTHDSLACNCSKMGDIPIPEEEEEERKCQLMKQSNSASKIFELLRWEHHGIPFDPEFLSQLCLKNSQENISFIFRSCKT